MTTLPAADELNQLSQTELIALVLQLVERVRQLEAEVEALKKRPTNSRNSSQPPSRDWKGNRLAGTTPKKRGAQPGHVKAERPWVDHPTRVVPASVTLCDQCGADLQHTPPTRTIRRQMVERPEIHAVVLETHQQFPF
jgi:hypothetical protein